MVLYSLLACNNHQRRRGIARKQLLPKLRHKDGRGTYWRRQQNVGGE
nr:MAG TPA: hypothetical protein [Caudoviricetes sp.]